MTASFRRENGKPQRVEAGIHLGLAVDSQRKDGSRFARRAGHQERRRARLRAFRAAYEELVAKARDSKLTVDEQTGATFTLTNPGGIGTVASVPRLMAGQGTIVAAGAIAYPPGFAHAPDSTLKSLGVEKVMTMTSTYDHRIIQGAQSGEYLNASTSCCTAPTVSTKRLRRARLARGAVRRRRSPRRRARRPNRRRPRREAVRRDAARHRGRHGARLGLSPSRPPRGASSIRSARRRPAIRRSIRRPTISRRR